MECYQNIIGKDDNRRSIHHIDFLLNNQYISDDGIIANAFNNYFVNVGSSLVKKNIRSYISSIRYVQNIESSLHNPEKNTGEISTRISTITNTASG